MDSKIIKGGDTVLTIKWQEGPIPEVGENGVQPDEVLEIVRARLLGLNDRESGLPSRETSLAITSIEEAILWLELRTRHRLYQGVEGSHIAHNDKATWPPSIERSVSQ